MALTSDLHGWDVSSFGAKWVLSLLLARGNFLAYEILGGCRKFLGGSSVRMMPRFRGWGGEAWHKVGDQPHDAGRKRFTDFCLMSARAVWDLYDGTRELDVNECMRCRICPQEVWVPRALNFFPMFNNTVPWC